MNVFKNISRSREKLRKPTSSLFLISASFFFLFANPIASIACGNFSPKTEVIRPSSVNALFDMPQVPRHMKVGDSFAIILPELEANSHWIVAGPESSVAEAFKPTDEIGPNAFAWRLTNSGSAIVMVTMKSDLSNEVRLFHVPLLIESGWSPPVLVLDESNESQIISFNQRAILKIRLAHPDNLVGYWQIEKGLNELDVEFGGIEAVRGRQDMNAKRWITEINIDTTHMPGEYLQLSFHAEADQFLTYNLKPVSYRLKGVYSPSC